MRVHLDRRILVLFTTLTFHMVSYQAKKSDCSTFYDAQQVLCEQALDIFSSVLSQESSCKHLW